MRSYGSHQAGKPKSSFEVGNHFAAMHLFRLCITCLLVLTEVVSAFNCSIPPIYVDIHKRIVHGTDVFQYGSFIGVGTPAQNQSLWPSLRQNETSVAHVDYCENSNLQNCERSTRGNFDVTESNT